MNYNGRTKMDYWKDWLGRNETEIDFAKMDRRESLYRGEVREITPLTERDRKRDGRKRETAHLRNIIAENIEAEVNSSIPQPKVTARRKSDERRAKVLEDMLRNELDRLPMEELNDLAERMVPIQGGAFWLVEWDNSIRTHSTVGDVIVSILHPKQVITQDGVFTKVEDMDAIILKLPQTKAYVERAYNVTLDNPSEEAPEARNIEAETADDMVTQYVAYYRNDEGGIGIYSWCCDTELVDMEDYEARRVRKCPVCGTVAGVGKDTCPTCGTPLSETESVAYAENVYKTITTQEGTQIPGADSHKDAMGNLLLTPTELPYFTPNVFPVFLQRNVSLFGKLLGDSDVDKITDQQNTINRLETKIIDRMIKAGTRITLPDRADFRVDPEDQEKWYIGSAADKQLIDVVQFDGNLTWEMQYLPMVYEESRQAIGITDSYQGRRDKTAESGVAKQFSAAQAAGRMESKRVLKEAAYAELFKRIVMLKVAYADEPRPVVAYDNRGQAQYEEFNRYDFYEQDENGWHCILDDDRFLFSCDTSAPLANNRERMWQETTTMFQMGAFGNPQEIDTLLLYWTKMDLLHYPGAGDTREYLENQKMQQMQQMQIQQAQMMAQQDAQRQAEAMAAERQSRQQRADAEQQAIRDTESQARNDAWRTIQQQLKQKQNQTITRPL
jgi:hypothetical protein